ncbi:MAG TPA: o-succinylbenzoate synthase [Candidatus Dormibacteraeota bacterium]|nr:o-succinylbenzoate synthase [Candidatus Dormibacteraeota bacterium]
MRIEHVELWEVPMRLRQPFRASTHAALELRHILLRVGGGGFEGWGEVTAPTDPFYLGETTGSAWHVLRDFLVPAVLGRPWRTVEELVGLYANVKDNTFARAGLEMAAWNLLAAERGCSVAELLGGTRRQVECGVSVGMEGDREALLATIARHREEGYRRVKVKIGPGADAGVLGPIRERFPDLPLMADANGAYDPARPQAVARLDRYGLTMIEQPLPWDRLLGHARLQAAMATPICLDESIRTAAQAADAIELGSCRVVNVKIGRVGGLLEARRIHDTCMARGVPVWCGGMHDYGVSRAACVALASLPGFTLPGDVSGSRKYFEEDVIEPEIVAREGLIAVPSGPRPYVVKERMIRALAVRCERF